MPSEGRGILSPVRLPVPPLQQVLGSFEVTTHSGFAHCNGSCGVRDMKVRDIGFFFCVVLFLASIYAKTKESHHDRLFASIGGQTD